MLDIIDAKKLPEILASILFVSGEGIDKKDIMSTLQLTEKQLNKALDELEEKYSNDCGIHLIRFKNKVQLSSNPEYGDCVVEVLNPIKEKAMTKKALEVLAIIAYKQPVTKLDIEHIRGVNSDYTVQLLLDNNFIEVVGRKDAVGKPILLGTSEKFLKRFNLTDINDLPDYESILERIQIVHKDDNSLYRNYDIPEDEIVSEESGIEQGEFLKSIEKEELPDFLNGEDVNLIE